MSAEQLRRLEYINRFAILCPKIVKPINYVQFAILNDAERDTCLMNAEKLIKKVQQELEASLRN